ncbi:unnamed protein product [Ilex paraguariensis]
MDQNNQELELLQQQQHHPNHGGGGSGGGWLCVRGMTDEQMELLRKQISAYCTLCEQLSEMHRAIKALPDPVGMKQGNTYDPLITSSASKVTLRQRWAPTHMQLQILERLYREGQGTPSRQKIKEITRELSQHGQITEKNVYNWFQNRRAKSKRKELGWNQNNVESEVETEVRFPQEKSSAAENTQSDENS